MKIFILFLVLFIIYYSFNYYENFSPCKYIGNNVNYTNNELNNICDEESIIPTTSSNILNKNTYITTQSISD